MIRGVLLLMLALVASPAIAHKASDAYLTIERDGAALRGQWDIALRDLDNALGLDANGDGDITWSEVRARHADIAAYALQRLDVSSGGERCALSATAQMIDSHTDGAYAVLAFSGRCAAPGLTSNFAKATGRRQGINRSRCTHQANCRSSSQPARTMSGCFFRPSC